jgi:hypothetical protein
MLLRVLLLAALYCIDCTTMRLTTIGGAHDMYEDGAGDDAVPCPVDGVIVWEHRGVRQGAAQH